MNTTNEIPPPSDILMRYIIEDIEIWANDYEQAIEIYNLIKY